MNENLILEILKRVAARTAIKTVEKVDDSVIMNKATSVTALDKRVENIKTISTQAVENFVLRKMGLTQLDVNLLNLVQGSDLLAITQADLNKGDLKGIPESISNVLSNEVNFTRSTVLPFLKEVITMVKERVANATTVSPAANFKINYVKVPDLLDMFSEYDEFKVVVNGAYLDTNRVALPAITSKADILERTKTSSIHIDVAVAEFMNNFTEEEAVTLYNEIFGDVSKDNGYIQSITKNLYANFNKLVFMFLVSRHLKDNQYDTTVADSTTYRKSLTNLYELTKMHIKAFVENILPYQTEQDTLILFTQENDIFINQTLINKKGAVAMDYVLGAAISNVKKYDDIVNNEELKSTWKKFYNDKVVEANNNLDKSYRSAYINVFAAMYEKIPARAKDILKLDDTAIFKMLEGKLIEKLSTLNSDELQDSITLIEEFYGEHIFTFTRAMKILDGMRKYEKLIPGIENNEAIIYSAIDVVVEYLVDTNIKISKGK